MHLQLLVCQIVSIYSLVLHVAQLRKFHLLSYFAFRLFHNNYSAPITVWYQACKYPISCLRWCLLYFNPESGVSDSSNRRFMSRLCEFFVIDKSENFYIYNLSKNLNRPVHVINFTQKHQSMERADLYQIS